MQERRETRVLLRRTGDSAPRGPAACTGARLGKERHTRMHQGAHPKLSQHCSSPACVSHVRLSVTPWTGADQAPLSTELSRQEYWSGSPFHPPGDLPNPGIEPEPLALARGYSDLKKKKSGGESRSRRCGRRDCFSRSLRAWHRGKPGLTSQDNKITGVRIGRGWSERINYVL